MLGRMSWAKVPRQVATKCFDGTKVLFERRFVLCNCCVLSVVRLSDDIEGGFNLWSRLAQQVADCPASPGGDERCATSSRRGRVGSSRAGFRVFHSQGNGGNPLRDIGVEWP